MKKFLSILSLTITTSVFANTVAVYNFDDVDSVQINGTNFSVEDLRDGFNKVNGVEVTDESIVVTSDSKAFLILRKSTPNKLFKPVTIDAKIGGDMGGG